MQCKLLQRDTTHPVHTINHHPDERNRWQHGMLIVYSSSNNSVECTECTFDEGFKPRRWKKQTRTGLQAQNQQSSQTKASQGSDRWWDTGRPQPPSQCQTHTTQAADHTSQHITLNQARCLARIATAERCLLPPAAAPPPAAAAAAAAAAMPCAFTARRRSSNKPPTSEAAGS